MDEVDSVSLPDGCFWTILSAAKKNFIWTGDEHGVIFPTCEEILIIGKAGLQYRLTFQGKLPIGAGRCGSKSAMLRDSLFILNY